MVSSVSVHMNLWARKCTSVTRKGKKQQCVLSQELETACSCIGILEDPHTRSMPTVAGHLDESQTITEICEKFLIQHRPSKL